MKILLTGATGYVGKRLLPVLVEQGHQVICCVRDAERLAIGEDLKSSIEVIEVDLLDSESLSSIPHDIDVAYYLVHSMSCSNNYADLEKQSAINFQQALDKTTAKQVIYLSGIVNEKTLSKHLKSRKQVENLLSQGKYSLTTFRAGIIIGSGSASFEIIRDLVNKLPVMVTPKWLHTKCQPIAISDVIQFLTKAINNHKTFNRNFDIGSPNVLSYKEMLMGYARMKGLKRSIFVVPVMTPRLSSYWLYFVTSTSYKLAVALVNSMKVEVVCRNAEANEVLDHHPMSYHRALLDTILEVENEKIESSWRDSFVSGDLSFKLADYVKVPSTGCFVDKRSKSFYDSSLSTEAIWSIGGTNGWYYANWLWKFRGFLDRVFGGVGLRRGRTNVADLGAGDAIDFWRVLYANKEEGRLLLYAEMKLPGHALLEFKLANGNVVQTATFKPSGGWGRLYWWSTFPLHNFIFNGMLNRIAQ